MASYSVNRTWIQSPVRDVIGQVWDYISDDSEFGFAGFEPRIDDDSRWYLASHEGRIVGAFWMRRVNHITWEAHANVVPSHWGDGKGTEVCRKALDVMIEDTGAKKVVAQIPTLCKPVLRMAEGIGFEREGVSVRAWQKNGKLYDVIHLGITRT